MNVGIVTTWFERGAAYVSRAYMETLSMKHNVFIYARGGEKYAQGDDKWDKEYVTWGKIKSNQDKSRIDFEDFKWWLIKNDINIIIFNEQNNWEIIIQIRELDIIIGSYIDYYTRDTLPFFWLYDFLLCNTIRHYNVFQNHPQVLYIPWGTDINIFKPSNRLASNDSITFFHSAGMSPNRKGTDLLVRAFEKIDGDAKLINHLQKPKSLDKATLKLVNMNQKITFIEKEI